MSFSLLRTATVSEINSVARMYEHDQTKAKLLSISNDDENKCFGINFRTPTSDSTGVAHILEHSVLCGSKKYPVKEPFVEIIKSSLQTFVNAFTYPDKTCYPCASTNLKDFYNLIDIYLDAVFFPNLTELTFMQEGWHYETDTPDGPLTFKGVVFNEMKGAYSSPDDLLGDLSRQSVYPDTPYRHDSGGDPLAIPDLSYSAFKLFHETFYHPSNSYIYFYGDDPEEERLRILDEALSSFSTVTVESRIPVQPNFKAPITKTAKYDSGESDDPKAHLTVNWKLQPATDIQASLEFSLIDHLLLGNAAAPVKRALLDSGLGEEIIGGLNDHMAESYFTIGLKGIKNDDLSKAEQLIHSTLEKVVKEGFDPESIKASLNSIEFHLREQNSGRFPRGLVLMLAALSTWIYDGDPIEAISYEEGLKTLKQVANKKGELEKLVKQWLMDNTHRATVNLLPDKNEGERRAAIERERLEKTRQALKFTDLEKIRLDANALKLHQDTPDTPEALATIPFLSLSDLDKNIKSTDTNVTIIDGVELHHQVIATNGIMYLDLGFELRQLPTRLVPYLGLLGKLMTELGTEKFDFVKLTQKIGQDTGGIRTAFFISDRYESGTIVSKLFIRAKALGHQMDSVLSLVLEMAKHTNLDQKEKIAQFVAERRSALESGLIPGGANVIHQRMKAHYSIADRTMEEISGVEQIFFLRNLANRIEIEWPSVLEDLKALFALLFTKHGLIINVTSDVKIAEQLVAAITPWLGYFSSDQGLLQTWEFSSLPKYELLTLPTQVNYVGSAHALFTNGYQFSGSANVINNYLQTTFLWEKVRVQGGAYGGFSVLDPITGVFDLLSYRDPNGHKTLDTYDLVGDFLKNLKISTPELEKTIIGTIGEIDAYLLPDAKGWQAFSRRMLGLSPELRQQRRNEIFACSAKDFSNFGQVINDLLSKQDEVILGSANLADPNTRINPKKYAVTKIL